MKKSSIALAVASALVAGAAGAANIDLYVSGASAQRTFWANDMLASICGANAQVTYSMTGSTVPDNTAYRCTATSTISGVTGVASGDQVTMHYSAELGSVYGIGPVLGDRPTTRLFVNPDSADCGAVVSNAATCAITAYSNDTETFTSANNTALVSVVPDVLVTDVDPLLWANDYNWPNKANLNPVSGFATPTTAQIAAIKSNYKVVNGQVFSVIVNNSGPMGNAGGNSSATKSLSRQTVASILAGNYATWGQVPELNDSTNTTAIKYCRRDIGSGTQVSASVFFGGAECNRAGAKNLASVALPGNLTSITEETSTGNVRTCVQGTAGAIGVTSVGFGTGYTTLYIDGVQPNAHNAAAGIYQFAFEDFVWDRSATTAGAGTGANGFALKLIANAKKAANMTAAKESTATFANGQWSATSPKANFAVPAGGYGNTKSIANVATISQASTALFSRGGDACSAVFTN